MNKLKPPKVVKKDSQKNLSKEPNNIHIINVRKEDDSDDSISVKNNSPVNKINKRKSSKQLKAQKKKLSSTPKKKMKTGDNSLAFGEYGNSFQWGSIIEINNYDINNFRPNLNLAEFLTMNNLA